MAKTADWYRTVHQDISGSIHVAAATDDQTLFTVPSTAYTLFIQRIVVWISTNAAQSWSFEDSNSSPIQIAEVTTSPGDSTRWDFDFGARGVPLTLGKNFLLAMSAAGLAGTVTWEGYARLNAPSVG